ncbi:MAG: fimbria/pilus periplasmic chaperone [Myxococcota bacterium]
MRERRGVAIAGILAILCGAAGVHRLAGAGGRMIIAPTRILLEGGERSATVHVGNHGDLPVALRISVVNKRMMESGLIIDAADTQPGETFAKHLIRYSPRQLVLEPNQTQTVRLLVRRPSGQPLSPGEYRSHLVFRSVPVPAPANEDAPEEAIDGIKIAVRAIIETSIPVIYRVGELPAAVRFSPADVHLESDPAAVPTLTLRLEREGKRSVYGDLVVDYVRPDLTWREVAHLGGVAVYHPTPSRLFRIGLQLPQGMRFDGGELRAHFRERNGEVEARIAIPLD